MAQATHMTLTAEASNTTRGQGAVAVTDNIFDIPADVQDHLDLILDYYADNALKPRLQICGDPLHIVSSLVVQLQKTLPETLVSSGKIVLDFLIGQITSFCRDNNAGRITFSFEFKR